MLNIQVSILTGPPTCVPREPVSLSHRVGFARHYYDDAVQESWLRLSRSDTSAVENLGGWLTTVVARVCLDMLLSHLLEKCHRLLDQ